jgi:hypothetical protein
MSPSMLARLDEFGEEQEEADDAGGAIITGGEGGDDGQGDQLVHVHVAAQDVAEGVPDDADGKQEGPDQGDEIHVELPQVGFPDLSDALGVDDLHAIHRAGPLDVVAGQHQEAAHEGDEEPEAGQPRRRRRLALAVSIMLRMAMLVVRRLDILNTNDSMGHQPAPLAPWGPPWGSTPDSALRFDILYPVR